MLSPGKQKQTVLPGRFRRRGVNPANSFRFLAVARVWRVVRLRRRGVNPPPGAAPQEGGESQKGPWAQIGRAHV